MDQTADIRFKDEENTFITNMVDDEYSSQPPIIKSVLPNIQPKHNALIKLADGSSSNTISASI